MVKSVGVRFPLLLGPLERSSTVSWKFEVDANDDLRLSCPPQEVIPTFDMAVNEIFFSRYPDSALEHQILVRTFNVDKTMTMRSLNPEDIDQLITISG